jgi:hypothetical protein
MERALSDKRVLITGRHLVRFYSRARRAKPASVVEAVLRWAGGCKMALRLFRPAAYAWGPPG